MTEHTIQAMNESKKRYADESGTIWVRWKQSKRLDILMLAIGMLVGQVLSFGYKYGPALGAVGAIAVAFYLRHSHGRDEG